MAPDFTTLQDMLERGNMLREGHFAFRSGVHATALIDRDLLLAYPGAASRFGYSIAKSFFTDHVEAIATPSGILCKTKADNTASPRRASA